jgi:glycine C-acetyltransferase
MFIDANRKVPRFNITFTLSSNNLEGKGLNIGQKGIAFLTVEEIIPADDIPFETEIKGYIFSEKTYSIRGRARILYSAKSKDDSAYYQNGMEFLELDENSQNNLFELLDDIRKYEKSISGRKTNKTLADFIYFPAMDIFEKTKIFYEIYESLLHKKYEMMSYHLDSASMSSSIFVNDRTDKSKKMVMMGSNNYLGLTTHPDVIKAGKDALEKYGSGNGSGVMVGGKITIHNDLEEELADFIGKESVILFNSGYAANLGIISGIARPNDAIVNDQYNHASIFDGCNLSGAKTLIFTHNDVNSLERILQRAKLKYNGSMIVVDGIYSSNGDISPLDRIVEIASRYDCRVMVDEAHGLGVIGENGRGATEYFGVSGKVDIIMGTMSKSLAGVGGFAASSKEVVEYLKFYGHSYLFSTGIPPATAASILKALRILRDDGGIMDNLRSNVNYFKSGLEKLNLNIGAPKGAIIPIIIPDLSVLTRMSSWLLEKGVYHNVFTYPAVPLGGSLLRFGIMATHSRTELQYVIDTIEEFVQKEKIFEEKRG